MNHHIAFFLLLLFFSIWTKNWIHEFEFVWRWYLLFIDLKLLFSKIQLEFHLQSSNNLECFFSFLESLLQVLFWIEIHREKIQQFLQKQHVLLDSIRYFLITNQLIWLFFWMSINILFSPVCMLTNPKKFGSFSQRKNTSLSFGIPDSFEIAFLCSFFANALSTYLAVMYFNFTALLKYLTQKKMCWYPYTFKKKKKKKRKRTITYHPSCGEGFWMVGGKLHSHNSLAFLLPIDFMLFFKVILNFVPKFIMNSYLHLLRIPIIK